MEPVTRRFVARSRTNVHYKAIGALTVVSFVAAAALARAIEALFPPIVATIVSPILYLSVFVGFLAALLRDTLGRKVTLNLQGDCLVVDGGRDGGFPLASAALGLWRTPGWGIVQGTILQLTSGQRRLRIGGMGHRTRPGVRVTLPADESYDVFFTAPGLDVMGAFGFGGQDVGDLAAGKGFPALLALMPIPVDNAPATEDLRCEVFGYMRFPVSGGSLGAIGEILLGSRDLSLRDAGGRTIWTIPRSAMAVRWGQHNYRPGRGPGVTHAVLQVWVGGRCALAIGLYDVRFGWHGPMQALDAPGYMVSTQDWEGIVARLGLGQWMRGPPPD